MLLNGILRFICPACSRDSGHKEIHYIPLIHTGKNNTTYLFNGDVDLPSVIPDVKYSPFCHFKIINGDVEYLECSAHCLIYRTVSLPDWEGV